MGVWLFWESVGFELICQRWAARSGLEGVIMLGSGGMLGCGALPQTTKTSATLKPLLNQPHTYPESPSDPLPGVFMT